MRLRIPTSSLDDFRLYTQLRLNYGVEPQRSLLQSTSLSVHLPSFVFGEVL